MPPSEKKLGDVFNSFAAKIVDGRELELLFRQSMQNSCTPQELKEFSNLPSPEGSPDNSDGIYISERSVYFSGSWMKRNVPEDHIPPALAPRVAAAMEEALQKAADHSDALKAGKLKPLPPPPAGNLF